MTFKRTRYAVLALQLHGVFCAGRQIKVGRTYAQIKDPETDRYMRGIETERLMGILPPPGIPPQSSPKPTIQQGGVVPGMGGMAPNLSLGAAQMQNMTLGQMLEAAKRNKEAVGNDPAEDLNKIIPSSVEEKKLGLDNKYCLVNIPEDVEEGRIKGLLQTWGRLRAFQLVAVQKGEETQACFFE